MRKDDISQCIPTKDDYKNLIDFREYLKSSNNSQYIFSNFINDVEKEKSKIDRAIGYLTAVAVGYKVIPNNTIAIVLKKAIRAFPRVLKGMTFLLEICACTFIKELEVDKEKEYLVPKRQLVFAVALLILFDYDFIRIKAMLQGSRLSRREEQDVADIKNILQHIDQLFALEDIYEKKRDIVSLLSKHISFKIAAVFTIVLAENIPISFIQEYYNLGLKETSKEQNPAENDNAECILALQKENEILKKEIEDLKNEKSRQIENERQAKIPSSLRAILN